MVVLGVYRETMFSPGRVDDDKQVMDATLREFEAMGYGTRAVSAELLDDALPDVLCVLTMAQSSRSLLILDAWSDHGIPIVNSTEAIRSCRRTVLVRALADAGLPLPAGGIVSLETGSAAERLSSLPFRHYWLKRGDVHRVEPGDVVKVTCPPDLALAIDHFRSRKIPKIIVQDHVEGEVVKFYGVRDGYFAVFGADLPSAVLHELGAIARRAAGAVNLEVYGGDAVITPDRQAVLIDLNAWPSFARCRDSAARHIAAYVTELLDGRLSRIGVHRQREEEQDVVARTSAGAGSTPRMPG